MSQLDRAGPQDPEGLAGEIEAHSIDIIPDDERRGRVHSQFTLWFATNANVFNFVLGGFAILFGLNVLWALTALVVGTLLGMAFTALHAVQGPRLGGSVIRRADVLRRADVTRRAGAPPGTAPP